MKTINSKQNNATDWSKLAVGDNLAVDLNRIYHADVIKLLLNVYHGRVTIDRLRVNRLIRLGVNGVVNLPNMEGKNGLINASPCHLIAEFVYENVLYFAEFLQEKDNIGCIHYRTYYSFPEKQIYNDRIAFELLKCAFQHTSDYSKGCVEIEYNGDYENVSHVEANFAEPPVRNLQNIFIKEDIMRDIERFIYTFKNFGELQTPLRFLLSGKPGLGKTEIIRAVISECSESGLVIIPKNMNGADRLIFEFAGLFTPTLVCLDDIDLVYGKREGMYGSHHLNSFLTMLDGILQNKFFLIATTNDKSLVDIAASRPGRFDEIIDFGEFDQKFYRDLICRQTNNEDIVRLFDEEVFAYMESKKVTGAFIVNLVKQLQIMTKMNPLFSKVDLNNYINRTYKGFYKSQLDDKKNFGFTN
jgi:cell division protease FtsH